MTIIMNQDKIQIWIMQIIALGMMFVIALIYDHDWITNFYLIAGGMLGVNIYKHLKDNAD